MWFWLQTTVLSLLLSSIYPKWYTQNIWEDFINISGVRKKNSGEPLWSAHSTWHQNASLSSPCDRDAMTSRICSFIDEEHVQMLTRWGNHICEFRVGCWEQGGWTTHDVRRVGVGNLYHSTSSCHWTHDKTQDTSLRENSSSHEEERLGKGRSDQTAGDHAMCDLPCSLLFSRILCYYSGLYVCYNIPNRKFTVCAILSIKLSVIKYIHIAVQPSPPSISTNLLSPQHQARFIQGQVPPKSNKACLVDVESQLLASS